MKGVCPAIHSTCRGVARAVQLSPGAHRDHHAPGQAQFGVLGDEQRIVGRHQMRENATGIEECVVAARFTPSPVASPLATRRV
jgi:hypothetical protein